MREITLVQTLVRQHFGLGTVHREGRAELVTFLAALGAQQGAEIGVWEGAYAECLCRGIPGLHLTCVDPWAAYADYHEAKNDAARLTQAYQRTVTRLRPYHCRILRMTSTEAAGQVADGSLDFVYIDGNHREPFVRADLEAWVPKVRAGGIVAGHDYTAPRASRPDLQVKAAVDAYVQRAGGLTVHVLTGDKSASWFWVAA